MYMNQGTVNKPDIVCKADGEKKNQMGESRIQSTLFWRKAEERQLVGRTGPGNKDVSLKGRGRGP